MIRKISWWILFLFYGIPLLVNVPWMIRIIHLFVSMPNAFQNKMAFPHPLPEFLAKIMPSSLGSILVAFSLLYLLLAVFPARRAWLMLSGQEESVPAAYNGLAQWLGMAGAFFIASFILGFIAAMISQTSSGAGDSVIKLLTPAFYLAPTGFTLTEIKSFMQRRAEKRRKARAMRPER